MGRNGKQKHTSYQELALCKCQAASWKTRTAIEILTIVLSSSMCHLCNHLIKGESTYQILQVTMQSFKIVQVKTVGSNTQSFSIIWNAPY